MLITLFLTKYKDDVFTLFCMATIFCSILEYLTSYIMEKIFKTRWWDYSQKKFNINGRICLETLLLFGILGLILIYLINPFLLDTLYKIDPILLKVVTSILMILFLIDVFVSTKIIYNIKDVSLTIKDSTEEMNKKVKAIIMNKNIFNRRVLKAFPDFKVISKVKNLRKK